MKKTTILLALILLNTIIYSCSSDDNPEPQETEPTENRLVKTEKISDTRKVDYVYNNNDLLSGGTGIFNSFGFIFNFSYDATNKITEWNHQETGSGTFSSNTFFTYDNSGNLISYDAVNLTYNGNIITVTGTIGGNQNATIFLEKNFNGLITKLTENDNYTIFEYNSDGNLIVAKNYNNSNVLLSTFNINYDQKLNPFYGQLASIYVERFIEFFYPFDGIYISGFEGYSFPFIKNNITSISENNIELTTYNYTYDTENYPLHIIGNSSTDTIEFDIEYYE
ncbi:hypothetical protein [Flavobacterium lacus]|nr:hypothetical protein [Flavobacterium lacus]